MNWKEQLFNEFADPNGNISVRGITLEHFISTEIIEKLIEDIPTTTLRIEEIKQQLRDRWL